MTFSEKLQIIRKLQGITQEKLAERLNISRQSVAKWECGMAYPDIMNLIQLSELFHITIDYLVKDNDCSKPITLVKDTDQITLIKFKLEAIQNTYAANANICSSSRPSSTDYHYENGDFSYYDTWVGGERFSGEEVIWNKGNPVFSMNYFGRTLGETFSTAFLKEALKNATLEQPYRGPGFYKSGEYIYKTEAVGDISWFQGYEEIFYYSEKVYECYYHGGILKS